MPLNNITLTPEYSLSGVYSSDINAHTIWVGAVIIFIFGMMACCVLNCWCTDGEVDWGLFMCCSVIPILIVLFTGFGVLIGTHNVDPEGWKKIIFKLVLGVWSDCWFTTMDPDGLPVAMSALASLALIAGSASLTFCQASLVADKCVGRSVKLPGVHNWKAPAVVGPRAAVAAVLGQPVAVRA
jgi:hypothetical protein